MRASFIVEKEKPSVVLVDRGPWNLHSTVTNDIENVIAHLVERKLLSIEGDELLFYFDSDGELSGAAVRNGKFRCFFHPNASDWKMLGY